jgi:predicted transcriptional regulator of viral defense system
VSVASPETTAFDLVGYADHCGGLDNVATVLVELAERLDPDRLRSIAPLSPLPWAQRLGFLLDRVGETSRTPALASYVSAAATGPVPLSPGNAHGPSERDKRWKIAVNVAIEPDL